MTASREPWWENSQNAALVVVALVVVIMILGFIADLSGYLRQTSSPQPLADIQSEEPTHNAERVA
jgi:hypothetical protein